MKSKMAIAKTNLPELFLAWLEKFKDAAGLQEDKDVAEVLGITPGSFSARKKAGSIPYKLVVDWCRAHHHSADELFEIETSNAKLRGDEGVIALAEAVVLEVEAWAEETGNAVTAEGKAKLVAHFLRGKLAR